jgi:plastocyanin
MGQAIHDQATLSGGNSPTGSITWKIYSSSDNSCSKVLGTVSEPVSGDGTYTSPGYNPSAPGSYQWVATYSGDAQNLTESTSCNDPKEQSTVSPATPSIVTHAASDTVGQPIYDVATLTGGDNPTGTITWNIYAAGACTTSLHTVSEMVSGDGTYNSPNWVPTTAGSYQWVATYSGDANNTSVATLCNDPNEQSSVQQTPAPGISLVKLERNGSSGSFTHGPITGNVGDTIDYEMTVVNTGNTRLVITFTDPHCDAGTLSVPAVISGIFDQATSTLSAGGELQYTCSHVLQTGDTPQFANTASVSGQPPQGPPVSATDTVVAQLNPPSTPLRPGIQVVKLQRDGSTGSFTTAPITAKVGDTIQYEIQVTNTGTAPLALTLSDPRCTPGTVSGPTVISGTLTGNVLSPGGEAQYTCSHVLTASDSSPFTNTATVTGQPPSGPPVSGTASVVANKQAVLPVTIKTVKCPKGKVKRSKKVHGKKRIVCVAKKRPIISRAPIHPSGFTG